MAARVEWKPAAAPVCKWSGGKRQLLPHLIASRPPQWNRYLEPFVGGGALFFALGQPDSYISDTNSELMNMYRVLRDNVDALIEHLGRHHNESSYYYAVRAQNPAHLSPLERASRLLFLLRVCWGDIRTPDTKSPVLQGRNVADMTLLYFNVLHKSAMVSVWGEERLTVRTV